jgi:hypothetical protein
MVSVGGIGRDPSEEGEFLACREAGFSSNKAHFLLASATSAVYKGPRIMKRDTRCKRGKSIFVEPTRRHQFEASASRGGVNATSRMAVKRLD